MKRYLFSILLVFLLAGNSSGATWYAQGVTPTFSHVSGTTISDVWNAAAGGGGAWMDWASNPQAGDTFEANAINGIIVDVDPKGTAAGNGKVILTNASNGYFVVTTGTITITADVTGNVVDLLRLSGGTTSIVGGGTISTSATAGIDAIIISSTATVNIGVAGTPVTITGSGGTGTPINITGTPTVTIYGTTTGGSAASAYAILCSHTGGTVSVTGNITGGSNVSGYGMYLSTTGSVTVTGDGIGDVAAGIRTASTGTVTVNGNCSGGAAAGSGCWGYLGAVTVTGNIIDTATGNGTQGAIIWSPSAATKYVKKIGDGSPAQYYLTSNVAGGAHPPIANVQTGVTYGWDGAAVYTGTLAGGGAWAH